MSNVKIATIDPDNDDIIKEDNAISIDMDVQSFEDCIIGIDAPEAVTQKLIEYIEKITRSSYEYKQYIGYLKNELDIRSCALMPQINIDDFNISLEFHHYPISLYNIVETVIAKQLSTRKSQDDSISMFDVMEEVMKEHYEGHIGLVPLTKTLHEMYHSDSLKIPHEMIYGNYDLFLAKYKKYMNPELVDKIMDAKAINKSDAEEMNKDKMTIAPMKYNIKYNKKQEDEE